MRKIIHNIDDPDEGWNLINNKKRGIGISLRTLCKPHRAKASLTVEAALVFPFFLLAIGRLLYWSSFLETQAALSEAANKAARKIAEESFSVMGEDGDDLIRVTKGAFLNGRYFTRTAVARPFTGRAFGTVEAAMEEEDTLVFVTKTGTVHHLSLRCPHLGLSVMNIDMKEVEKRRNEKGGKYYPCEFCMRQRPNRKVFITEDGTRVHNRKTCRGIKRSILSIPKKEAIAKGLGACGRCGR